MRCQSADRNAIISIAREGIRRELPNVGGAAHKSNPSHRPTTTLTRFQALAIDSLGHYAA
jgi:hypothetical protein